MSLIKTIQANHPIMAWSPIYGNYQYIAAGIKGEGAGGFDDVDSKLIIYDISLDKKNQNELNEKFIEEKDEFQKLSWGVVTKLKSQFPYGIIAGGLQSGKLKLYNAEKLINGDLDNVLVRVLLLY